MQHPPVQAALTQARTNIEAAREARGNDRTVIRHYRKVKDILDDVDDAETNPTFLNEMIAAFRDLAGVLDDSGEQFKEKAVKCRLRADILRQKLDGKMKVYAAATAPSLMGSGLFPIVAQAVFAQWSNSVASTSSTASKSNVVATSTANALTPQQLPTSSFISTISVTAANGIPAPSGSFSRDVNSEPITCSLPDPGKPLDDTRQLAYCLALFQDSIQDDDIPRNALTWRCSNPNEKGRLETLSIQVVKAFVEDTMKDSAAVAEVVHLAPVLEGEYSRSLLTAFIDAVNKSEIFHLHSMEGLAKVVQGAAPGSIDSDDLVAILHSLHKRLESTHSASHHTYYLLLAVSRVLDAMADSDVGDVDRVNLHGPLTDLLRESESSKNPYLTFQAEYATQALLNVSDDDNIWRAGFRRLWLVLKGGAGLAKIPDPKEIKDALEGLERLCEAGKGGARMLKETLEAIKSRERPTFTAKEGLKFKRAWYRAIRTAESYIQTGRLIFFKDLVTTVPCRHQLVFQWGTCQLLGQFAADIQWDLEARNDAVTFLGELYRDTNLWIRQKGLDRVIFDVLTDFVSNKDAHSAAAVTLLDEIGNQSTGLKSTSNLLWLPWKNTPPANIAKTATSKVTLSWAVQDINRRHAKIENIPDLLQQPTLDDVRSAISAYHAPDLFIRRVSGKELDMETCFVNLAIVEAVEHRQNEKQDLKDQANVFHRFPSFERVKNTNTQSLIPLEKLFDKRELRDGTYSAPKRILVQGRAGIGKTTLCKKLVHAHQNGLWKDMFDIVLWIPLRQLRLFKKSTLEDLFHDKVFYAQILKQEQEALAKALAIRAQTGRVLFILDGLDEIVSDTQGDEGRAFSSFLIMLLSQQNVVVTSRPSGVDSKLLPRLDLELETVGFSPRNVKDFLVNVLEPEVARTVQDFIRQTPMIQTLVNIPVQLDVICFSWDSLPRDGMAITMTGLYQLMVRKLWCKDAHRLQKAKGGQCLKEEEIHDLSSKSIDRLMATELQHLGYLAFKGLNNNHQIEFDKVALLSAFEDLQDDSAGNQPLLLPQLVEVMKQTSFLHTADVDTNFTNGSRQAWHFLHLTFQEYFAATWIVCHFHQQLPCHSAGMMTIEQVRAFVHQHKYNPRYEIVWSMVAGLLEGKSSSDFFEVLQGEPRDLIGGRHHRILASCLNEARNRLDSAVVEALDSELTKWLHFEMNLCHDYSPSSMLGSQLSFPEAPLVETLSALSSECLWKTTAINSLGARLVLSDLAAQSLILALKDDDWKVRYSAALALSRQSTLPESTIQNLVAALKDENKNVKSAAATALGNQIMLSESVQHPLVATLKDEDRQVRALATLALAKQPESVIQSLISALRDDDERLRSSAASALCHPRDFVPVIQPITAGLKNDIAEVRQVWERPVCRSVLMESAIQSLVAMLRDEQLYVRTSAASVLGNQSTLPESTIQLLVAALDHRDSSVRSSAASALGRQSTLQESAFQSLVAALKDEGSDVRSSAVSAIRRQSKLPQSVIQSLVAALKDEHINVRYSAASASGRQSTLPESAIQSLVAALKDKDSGVRLSAVSAIRRQSTLPESVIQSLVAALKDEDPIVRSSAASALGRQSTLPKSVILLLVAALKDEHENVRSSALWAFGNQSTLPESVIQSLVAALKDKHINVRATAAWVIRRQSTLPQSVIQSLISALKDENINVRSSATSALSKQPTLPESIIQSLVAALKDENSSVRSSAVLILGNQSTLLESAIQSLIAALKDEHKYVRSSAASALSKQSMLPESAIKLLLAALKDEDRNLTLNVLGVLRQQNHSLCISLPHLIEDEITCLYKSHQFLYSCSHVMSLQAQDGKLCFYTEQGVLRLEPIDNGKAEIISSAFRAAQYKAGLISPTS